MIPLIKIKIDEEEKKSVLDVLESGMITQSKKVAQFEQEFSELCGTKYAIAVNSGTAALHSALYALGIKEGDEVITTPFTFAATANAIIMLGAKPIFADIEEETFNLDPKKVEEKITSKTKAILPVNLFGHPYEVENINELAKKYNLQVLEDACQSVCAKFKNKISGDFGDIAAFSFYATKNMMTGEGGMITTNKEEYAELAKRFRHHGQSEKTKYEYLDLGYNYRMTDISAAIGICQLKKIKELTKKRQKNAETLTRGLSGLNGLITPKTKDNNEHAFHQYTLRITEEFGISRDEFSEKLKEKGIGTAIFYPKCLHLHAHFSRFGYNKGDFPVAEKISQEVLSLPIQPYLQETELNKIIKVIRGLKDE